MKKIIDDKYAKKLGWVKKSGFKINLELMRDQPDDWEYLFLDKENMDDYIEKTSFWQLEGTDECFEDIDSLLEFLEDEYDDDPEGVEPQKHFKRILENK